jgi:hypothetical protein
MTWFENRNISDNRCIGDRLAWIPNELESGLRASFYGATIGGASRYPNPTNLRARSTIERTISVPAGHCALYLIFMFGGVPRDMKTNLKMNGLGSGRQSDRLFKA